MGEVLGLGLTHYPGLFYPDQFMAHLMLRVLDSPRADPRDRDPVNWPGGMRLEWGEDKGLTAARNHRDGQVRAFRRIRAALDEFQPDCVLIFGDDQYENFKEDIIPPFCVFLSEEMVTRPFAQPPPFARGKPEYGEIGNVWDEAADKEFHYRGHREAGTFIVNRLVDSGFDIGFAYRGLHRETLAHAFENTLIYLDYDRRGFPYPIVPFHVNCYSKRVLPTGKGGGIRYFTDDRAAGDSAVVPPNGPTPKRCFELGKALRQAIQQSPWRIAVMGSSSWSHATLTEKHRYLYPDIEADHVLYRQLVEGRQAEWSELSLDTLEGSGQHELRNWICLAGVVSGQKPRYSEFFPTYIFNSDKCYAIF